MILTTHQPLFLPWPGFFHKAAQSDPLKFHPPVYPQLRGEFIYNLSTLDLLLNCGPKSAGIIAEA